MLCFSTYYLILINHNTLQGIIPNLQIDFQFSPVSTWGSLTSMVAP